MHGNDFLVDVDVNAPDQVDFASTLNIQINDGLQEFPADSNTAGANRLLIFTGTAVNAGIVGHDSNLARGVFRVRLRFPLSKSIIFKASATVAALASLHGEGNEEDWTFAADAAVTVQDPTDGLTVPNPNNLPTSELYVIIDAAYQGDGSRLARISYQANVLVQNAEPNLDSILVRPAGGGQFFDHINLNLISTGQPALWDFQLNLTGPVPQGTFAVDVQSDDPSHVQLAAQHVVINSPDSSTVVTNNSVLGTAPNELVTITATHTADTGQQTTKTATLNISAVPK